MVTLNVTKFEFGIDIIFDLTSSIQAIDQSLTKYIFDDMSEPGLLVDHKLFQKQSRTPSRHLSAQSNPQPRVSSKCSRVRKIHKCQRRPHSFCTSCCRSHVTNYSMPSGISPCFPRFLTDLLLLRTAPKGTKKYPGEAKEGMIYTT